MLTYIFLQLRKGAETALQNTHAAQLLRMKSKIKAVLIDLSGTLHVEDSTILGAPEALERLRAAGVSVRFITNTTKESLTTLHGRLRRLGFGISHREVFSSLSAARRLVDSRQLRPLLLLSQDALREFDGVNTDDPNAVLVGLAPDQLNYDTLTKAFRLVLDGAPLVAIHKARYYRRADGLALGPGPFVAALEYATGRHAEVVGKPQIEFFHAALDGLNCRPDEAIMIGDDARDDIAGAQAAGLRGVLVRTGKYRAGDEVAISPPPAYTAHAFPHAVQQVLHWIDQETGGSDRSWGD